MTMTEDRLDAAFAALADPTRRAIVSRLAEGDATVSELAAPFPMSLPGVSKHLKVLERSGLISRRRDAQFRPCHLEVDALDGAARLDRPAPAHLGRALRQARCPPARHPACATQGNGAAARARRGAGTRNGAAQGRRERTGRMTGHPTNELRFTRVFEAPRELVFAMHDRSRPPHPLLGADRRQRAP